MNRKIFIEGMSCGHCVNHVEEALKEIPGVKAVKVDLAGKYAIVKLDHEVDPEKFRVAIDEAGYEVTHME